MPSTRRRPNTVASQATAGAMKICEPIAAVLSQAPSSNPNEKAPRRSGNPTDVSRLSKLARKEPSSTAATANSGWRAMPPRETGPSAWSAAIVSVIGLNVRHDRHSRQQALQQRLVLVELDPDRNALDHFGEIAGGVIGRQQRELRAAGGRDPLDAAMQLLVRKAVDRDVDGLAGLDPRELGFLVIGHHIDVRQRHDIDEVAADIDVIARLNLAFADDAVERRDDFGIAELEARRGKGGLRAQHVGGALLLGSGQHFHLVTLRGDHGPAGANIGLRLGV